LEEFNELEKMRNNCKSDVECYVHLLRNTVDRKCCSCLLYRENRRI
jgi:hypothetical protein